MADGIADMLAQSGLQSSQKAPDLAGSFAQGAQLAQTVEQTQMLRQQIEKQRKESELAKVAKIGEWFETAAKMPEGGARKAFLKKFVPNGIAALGMQDKIDPTALSMIESQPEIVGFLKDKLEKREIEMADIQRSLVDPEFLASFMNRNELSTFGGEQALRRAATEYPETLAKAGSVGAANVEKMLRAQEVGGMALGRQVQAQQATGQVKLAGEAAKSFEEYQGGKSAMISSLEKLNNAASALESGTVTTGGITTKIPGFKSDTVQSIVNPALLEMKTEAQAALNAVLRQTLGAQFTQQEGERVLSQIWDDKLSPAVNAKKIRAKITELQRNISDKENLYVKQGLMRPEERTSFAPKGLTKTQKDLYKKATPGIQQQMIQKIVEQMNIAEDKARKMLEE